MSLRVVAGLSFARLATGYRFSGMNDRDGGEHNLPACKDRIRIHLRWGDHEGSWCLASKACHADLLLELVNRPHTPKTAESHVTIA